MIAGISEKNFKVIIRVRPLSNKEEEEINSYELSHAKKIRSSAGRNSIKLTPSAYAFYAKYYNFPISQVLTISKPDKTIYLADPQYKNIDKRTKGFTYSNVYCSEDDNMTIFNENLKTDVQKVLQGYNCTILAYGITGSGKTYTVFGKDSNAIAYNSKEPSKNVGISYQAFDHLLKQRDQLIHREGVNIKRVDFKFSFIEIYNENVRDLLSTENNKYLNIVEDGKGNTSVSDVTEISIRDITEINAYIMSGTSKRAFASTHANQYSSRSHAILQLQVQIQKANTQEKIGAKLFIIDLAGSEKIQSLNCSKKMQEGANINKSLLALGNCITTLSQNSRKNIVSHIPYRDSKLTRMLKDSLGGNTKTIMIGCISPNPFVIEETTTTLNYALRAQVINKKLMKNCSQQEEDFVCCKCKKKEVNDKDNLFNELPFDFEIDQVFVEKVYEDIVENAKQKEKIDESIRQNIWAEEELHQLLEINEKQKNQLKNILMSLFVCQTKKTKKPKQSSQQLQNKENCWIQHSPEPKPEPLSASTQLKTGNLSCSKSRRRRSHNKFQIPKKLCTE